MDALEDETGLEKRLETGFDDDLDYSPLLENYMKTSLSRNNSPKKVKGSSPGRASTPTQVDEEQDEYELFFTVVSSDGFSQSGKDLETIWNEILNKLEDSGNFPGSAPRWTRPDVYKVGFPRAPCLGCSRGPRKFSNSFLSIKNENFSLPVSTLNIKNFVNFSWFL